MCASTKTLLRKYENLCISIIDDILVGIRWILEHSKNQNFYKIYIIYGYNDVGMHVWWITMYDMEQITSGSIIIILF